ncbi:hypothetical protein Tco_0461431, partial [Tanacetum coccineum]
MFPLLLRQLKLLEFEKFAILVLFFLSSLSSYKELLEIARLALVDENWLRLWALGFQLCINGYVYFTPIKTHMQRQEEKVDMREVVDAGLVVTESSGTKPDKQNTSSSSGTPLLAQKPQLICNLKKQIKSVKETSNEAKVKNDIDVIETINIELEHSVAKLLAANEQLHKENEHLKQTYKELFDTIKKTRVQNKDNSDSLISQINQKSVKNADLKAQIQEKVFANAALKNELRKLKGNIIDSKFAKASILGKPPLQPSRNHLVVRQPNAFTSERPRMSRPRFASQVDKKNDLSKTVTPHYLPKVRESAAAKPHQVNAPNYSRNSHKESYGSNDMVHAYFLENDRKMTQDKTRIPNHMCMFALTVSIVEPKNIKEAMADSAWIEAMQGELHQFDRLKVWELVDKPFGKMIDKCLI